MSPPRTALIMGVSNHRSIAWGITKSFLEKGWQVVLTYQTDAIQSKVETSLIPKVGGGRDGNNVLGGFACDVSSQQTMETTLTLQLADLLKDRPLDAIVHSLAHAPNLKLPLLETSMEDFTKAHEISAYSLIGVARATQPFLSTANSSITALSYLGAVRAIPGYHSMGPAKASLEAVVRGLALEMAVTQTRVNAVSAGPIATLSAKGGIANFNTMLEDVNQRAPLGNVTQEQVASTVEFLASEGGTGITGQTIYVDGGYSIVGGPASPSLP
ncbi:unnamed protein product [Cylindrotheca closterium]|uniref:Enoyl-[acyl-carrier-protein] reductase (NADH) n=1 Tax=Cylindrotheca closterium TaxID=2856 RepID=A0AAD2PVS6_9STRA|nr:unnamed protein product [Cylindrotheca closterium]